MNDQMFAPAAEFATTAEFLGPDGYAQQIYDMAYEVLGEYERQLIPLDSPVAWMAGRTYLDVAEMCNEDPVKVEQFRDNAPYAMTGGGAAPGKDVYLGTAADWQEVEDSIKWVRECWENNLGPDPNQFDSIVSSAADASNDLYNEHSGVGKADPAYRSASTALEGWQSDAARDFRDFYWNELPTVIGNQAVTAAVLAHGASAIRAAWSRHRADLEDIANKTLTALEAVRSSSQTDPAAFLSILGGLVTIAGGLIAIPSGGTSLALAGATVSIISGSITVARGTVASEGEGTKVPLGGETVMSVLFNMASALAQAKTEIQQADRDIAAGLSELNRVITSNETVDGSSKTLRSLYVFPPPLIVEPSEELPEPPIPT